MSLRFNALNRLSQTSAEQVEGTTKITAIFGENVFDLKKPASTSAMKRIKACWAPSAPARRFNAM